MEMDVFTNTYNRHAKKAWKKTKCKRQVRKIGKTMEKDFSKEPAAYTMFGSREEKDEEGEREQLRQQQEERLKKNQEWRARKQQQEKIEETPQKIAVDKKKRNERIQNLLICTHSRKPLRAGDEIWTSSDGDLVRGDFVDPDLVKMTDIPEEEAERRGSGPESGIEEDLGTVSGPTTNRSLSHTFSQLEVGSYVRPALDNIDFFAHTLDIRKDAIRPYENYNPQEEEEVMSNLGGSHDDDIEETEFYNKYLHESCPPPIQSSSSPDSSLRPVTLDLAQEQEADTGEQKSWRQQFEMNKREVDFFSNTLDIRKDAIACYQDYKKEAFSKGSITEEEEESDDSDSEEENEENRMSSQQLTRNLHAERIVMLFNEMMVYRNIIEEA